MKRHRLDAVSMAFGLMFALVAVLGFTDNLDTGGEVAGVLLPGIIVIIAVSIAAGALAPNRPAPLLATATGSGLGALGATQGAGDDPNGLGDPWRRFVTQAEQARDRYVDAVANTREGPLHDRLAGIGRRIDAGVDDVRHVAIRGQSLAQACAKLDPTATIADLSQAEAELAGLPDSRHLQAEVESLRAQLASAERMAATVEEATQQLRLLDVRLNETVARAIELSVGAANESGLRNLDDDVDNIVDELEALRLAVEDTNSAGGGA
jgi:hypothetical protein